MALIDLKAVCKRYEAQTILDNADFAVESGERVAIVGKNGGGKTTLIKIALGRLEPDDGVRIAQNDITIDALDQDPILDGNLTVKETIENSLAHIASLKAEYARLTSELELRPNDKTLINNLSAIGERIDFFGGWNLSDRVDRILTEFNLKAFEKSRIFTLSGGEKRRVALGALLLKKPNILALDEPTNHLDVYMVRFLEELLLESKSALIVISHDRYFIEQIATRTIEIENGRLRSFNGGYNLYLEQKAAMLESMIKSHETLVKLLRAEQEWLNRGVKARLKRNIGRVERIKQMKEDAKQNPSIIHKIKLELEREQKTFNQEKSVNKKKALFELNDVSIGIGDKILVNNISARILQQDKIAIVGRNGSGKTTLLLTLQGIQKPLGGAIETLTDNIGYFDQDRAALDDNKNLLETFCPNGGDHIVVRGRNMHVFGYMKSWLFPKEFLDKKIGSLSGGEKNRVALALLFSKKYDCLILDEPTNDLDIPTINILEEYLQSYQGALIFVSHDRYFVDKVAKKIWILKENNTLTESLESYSEYLDYEAYCAQIDQIEKNREREPVAVKAKKRQNKLSYKDQRLYETLPAEIDELEDAIKRLNEIMTSGVCQQNDLVKMHIERETLKKTLDEKVDIYLQIDERKNDYAF
ncbi:MAG: ABC-F family ATP-binding cassette domain-containing protein [Helicobacteraceae bacterium]|nr:ABC-F family ATP-binding cassette domain-containing protein [Helicobacteraceae bacterium]